MKIISKIKLSIILILLLLAGVNIQIFANADNDNADNDNIEVDNLDSGDVIGHHSIYGIGASGNASDPTGQAHRNMYLSQLVVDYIDRNYDGNFDGIFVTNQGSLAFNSDTAGFSYHWEARSDFTRTTLNNHFNNQAARNNHIVFVEMTGRDLITLLSIPNQMANATQFGINGQIIVSGAFRGDNLDNEVISGYNLPRFEWFFNDGTPIVDNETSTYTIAVQNHIAIGGQRIPLPGNVYGDRLRMEILSPMYSLHPDGGSSPFADFVNNVATPRRTVVDAMALEITYRSTLNPEDYTSWLYIESEGNGTANIGILAEGVGGAANIVAHSFAPFSPFADRVLNVNGTRVFLNAIPARGYEFTGWYDESGTRLSTSPIFSYYHTEETKIIARFEETDYIVIDLFSFADFHGMVDNLMDDDTPGAASFAAYAAMRMNENPGNSVLLAAGDNYHGHPLSTHLMGRPTVSLFEYMDVSYSSFGNHEMSFGAGYDTMFGPEMTFLAADLVYAGTDEHPSFVEPYTILEFDDHGVKIGMIGFMTGSMATSTSPVFLAPYDLRTPTLSHAMQEWIDYIQYLIDRLNYYYEVEAIVALTHMVPNEARQLAALFPNELQAVIAGHLHTRHHSMVGETHVIEPGWHGRTLGRITLEFDAETYELMSTSAALSAQNAIRNFSGHTIYNDAGVATIIPAHPEFANWLHVYEDVAEMIEYYSRNASNFLDEELAPRGIYGVGPGRTNAQGRYHRDAWIMRIVEDYIHRSYDGTFGEFTGIVIANPGGWRNTPTMWQFEPTDPFRMRDLIVTSPFSDHIVLHEMTGRDLITLLSMEQGGNVLNNTFGISSSHISMSGAFRGDFIGMENINGHYRPRYDWFFTDGAQVTDSDFVTYIIASRNHVANGGSRFPFPNNSWGQLLGMTEVNPPQSLLIDGSTMPLSQVPESPDEQELMTIPVRFLRDAIASQLRHRSGYDLEDLSSWVYIEANGSGVATITLPLSPFNDRLLAINGTRVFATATPDEDFDFVGWYVDGVRISENKSFSFQHHEDQTLVALFSDGELVVPIRTLRIHDDGEEAEDFTLDLPGGYRQLEAVVNPVQSTERYQWISSDESVATVSEAGLVSAVAQGSATITLRAAIPVAPLSNEKSVIYDSIVVTVEEETVIDQELRAALEKLQALVNSVSELDVTAFTESSWDVLQAAFNVAELALGSDDLEVVSGATVALQAAIDALEEDVPVVLPEPELEAARSALQTLINRVNEMNAEDFTEASWNVLQLVMTEAIRTVETDDLVAILAITTDLLAAFDELTTYVPEGVEPELKEARIALRKLIAVMVQLSETEFTQASWSVLQEALEVAMYALETESLEAIQTAITVLQAAFDALEESVAQIILPDPVLEAVRVTLAERIAYVDGLRAEDFTESSWTLLLATRQMAVLSLESEHVDVIKGAITALNAAIDALTLTTNNNQGGGNIGGNNDQGGGNNDQGGGNNDQGGGNNDQGGGNNNQGGGNNDQGGGNNDLGGPNNNQGGKSATLPQTGATVAGTTLFGTMALTAGIVVSKHNKKY